MQNLIQIKRIILTAGKAQYQRCRRQTWASTCPDGPYWRASSFSM